jgi:hypothetical protein
VITTVTPFTDEVCVQVVQRTKERLALLRETFTQVENREALAVLALAERALDEAVRDATPNPNDKLTLAEAAAWSGYSKGYLTSLLRVGALQNYGRKRHPRLLRADLPIKGLARAR